jgi:hypothetical protein
MTAIGSSWRMAPDRSVSPKNRKSGTTPAAYRPALTEIRGIFR